MKRTPQLVVLLALEGRPWILIDAETHEDELRLWTWLDGSQALIQLAARLIELAGDRKHGEAA